MRPQRAQDISHRASTSRTGKRCAMHLVVCICTLSLELSLAHANSYSTPPGPRRNKEMSKRCLKTPPAAHTGLMSYHFSHPTPLCMFPTCVTLCRLVRRTCWRRFLTLWAVNESQPFDAMLCATLVPNAYAPAHQTAVTHYPSCCQNTKIEHQANVVQNSLRAM